MTYIVGYYGNDSLGDEIILEGMLKLFGADSKVLNILNLPDPITITEPVVVGGGTIIGLNGTMSGDLLMWLSKLSVPYSCFGVTMNARYASQRNIPSDLQNGVFSRAKMIAVTNPLSVRIYNRNFDFGNCSIGGYAAAVLDYREPTTRDTRYINLRHPGWAGFKGMDLSWYLGQAMILTASSECVGIAFDGQDYDFMHALGLDVKLPNTFTELQTILDDASEIVTMRLHLSLAGLLSNIPTKILAYEYKCIQLAESTDLDYVNIRYSEHWSKDIAAMNRCSLVTRPYHLVPFLIQQQANMCKRGLGIK